jgi:DNA-binding response OmpR family regulator
VDGNLKAPSATRQPRRDLTGLRILVVEDNEDNRDMLTTYFDMCGAAVFQAADAETALSHAKLLRLDAVISDLTLQKGAGFDLIARIRSASTQNATVFGIAVSGLSTTEDAVLAAGYDRYFMKPVDLDDLCDAILNRRRDAPGKARLPARGFES